MTNLQILLDYLTLDQSVKDDLILEYFDHQDSSEFYVEDTTYSLFTYDEVRELLKNEATEELDDFFHSCYRNSPQYTELVSILKDSMNELVANVIEGRDENDVKEYEFVTTLTGNLYLFTA